MENLGFFTVKCPLLDGGELGIPKVYNKFSLYMIGTNFKFNK